MSRVTSISHGVSSSDVTSALFFEESPVVCDGAGGNHSTSSPLSPSCERHFETFFRVSEHMRHNVESLVIRFDVPVRIALRIKTRAQRASRRGSFFPSILKVCFC